MRAFALKTAGRDERGATLLEFLIYIAIVGVVLTVSILFAAEFVASQSKSAAVIEVSRNARFAAERVAAEIRQATSVNSGGTIYGAHPGALSLVMAAAGDNPTVFAVTNGVLTVQQGAGAAIALTSSRVEVTNFVLTNLSNGNKTKAVGISLTVKFRNEDDLVQFRAETTLETTARIHKDDGFAP